MELLLLEDKLSKIVNQLNIPDTFGKYEESDEPNYDIAWEVSGDYETETGASKYVIIPDNASYVIKIPFDGYFNDEETYNEETEEYEYEDTAFISFECAEADENWNYCEAELNIYDMAVEAGFGEFFAETLAFKYQNSRMTYLQEKCITYSNKRNENASDTSIAIAKNISRSKYNSKYYHRFSDSWIADCIDYYGLEKTLAFIQYASANHIDDDMHYGNFGYSQKDGRPVLIDFSSFDS